MLDKYPQDVKLVPKNFPLSNHKFAFKAASAALASDRQGKFWEFHEKLYRNYKSINDAKIQEIARELGLDMEKFDKDKDDQAIRQLIMKDLNDARQAGVRGTPSIFVNGKLLRNRSLQGFQQMIDAEIQKKR